MVEFSHCPAKWKKPRWRCISSGALGFALGFSASSAMATGSQTAVVAGGCFWGVESVFEHVRGVTDVVSGYAGGHRDVLARPGEYSPGSAEAVRITFDPSQITYQRLLEIFMTVAHDPTQIDRQGPDVGTRYRSAIFPRDKEQREVAEGLLAQLQSSRAFPRPIATRIENGGFAAADASQQDFVEKHPTTNYVVINDLPKLRELNRKYPSLWKS